MTACSVDPRPALNDDQFATIVKKCRLSEKVELRRSDDGQPMIVLTGSGTTKAQIDCIRAEQETLGATADMAN